MAVSAAADGVQEAGGGLSDSRLSVPAHSRSVVVVLKPLVSSPAMRSACRCHMMLLVTVPGLGMRCRGGGGSGGGSGLWGCRMLSSSYGVGMLLLLVQYVIPIYSSLSPAAPKLVWLP